MTKEQKERRVIATHLLGHILAGRAHPTFEREWIVKETVLMADLLIAELDREPTDG
jgi:hypothetical protein